MKYKILLFMLCLLLDGCGSKHMPLAYHCSKIELPNDPIDYTKMLTEFSTPDEVMKAWVTTAIGYKEWNTIVKEQINYK